VVLGTSDYNKKVVTLLQDKAYAKLRKDPTESIEHKTVLLLKSPHFLRRCASKYDHRVPGHLGFMGCRISQTWCATKTHFNHHWLPTYRLAQHLARLLSGHTGHSPHRIENSIEFVQALGSLQVDTHDIMVSFAIVPLSPRCQ
jgi:hypothetical protein